MIHGLGVPLALPSFCPDEKLRQLEGQRRRVRERKRGGRERAEENEKPDRRVHRGK